jgi:hypothetical protein
MTGLDAKRSPKNAMTLDELFGTATDVAAVDLAVPVPAPEPDPATPVPVGTSHDGGMSTGVGAVTMDPPPTSGDQ